MAKTTEFTDLLIDVAVKKIASGARVEWDDIDIHPEFRTPEQIKFIADRGSRRYAEIKPYIPAIKKAFQENFERNEQEEVGQQEIDFLNGKSINPKLSKVSPPYKQRYKIHPYLPYTMYAPNYHQKLGRQLGINIPRYFSVECQEIEPVWPTDSRFRLAQSGWGDSAWAMVPDYPDIALTLLFRLKIIGPTRNLKILTPHEQYEIVEREFFREYVPVPPSRYKEGQEYNNFKPYDQSLSDEESKKIWAEEKDRRLFELGAAGREPFAKFYNKVLYTGELPPIDIDASSPSEMSPISIEQITGRLVPWDTLGYDINGNDARTDNGLSEDQRKVIDYLKRDSIEKAITISDRLMDMVGACPRWYATNTRGGLHGRFDPTSTRTDLRAFANLIEEMFPSQERVKKLKIVSVDKALFEKTPGSHGSVYRGIGTKKDSPTSIPLAPIEEYFDIMPHLVELYEHTKDKNHKLDGEKYDLFLKNYSPNDLNDFGNKSLPRERLSEGSIGSNLIDPNDPLNTKHVIKDSEKRLKQSKKSKSKSELKKPKNPYVFREDINGAKFDETKEIISSLFKNKGDFPRHDCRLALVGWLYHMRFKPESISDILRHTTGNPQDIDPIIRDGADKAKNYEKMWGKPKLIEILGKETFETLNDTLRFEIRVSRILDEEESRSVDDRSVEYYESYLESNESKESVATKTDQSDTNKTIDDQPIDGNIDDQDSKESLLKNYKEIDLSEYKIPLTPRAIALANSCLNERGEYDFSPFTPTQTPSGAPPALYRVAKVMNEYADDLDVKGRRAMAKEIGQVLAIAKAPRYVAENTVKALASQDDRVLISYDETITSMVTALDWMEGAKNYENNDYLITKKIRRDYSSALGDDFKDIGVPSKNAANAQVHMPWSHNDKVFYGKVIDVADSKNDPKYKSIISMGRRMVWCMQTTIEKHCPGGTVNGFTFNSHGHVSSHAIRCELHTCPTCRGRSGLNIPTWILNNFESERYLVLEVNFKKMEGFTWNGDHESGVKYFKASKDWKAFKTKRIPNENESSKSKSNNKSIDKTIAWRMFHKIGGLYIVMEIDMMIGDRSVKTLETLHKMKLFENQSCTKIERKREMVASMVLQAKSEMGFTHDEIILRHSSKWLKLETDRLDEIRKVNFSDIYRKASIEAYYRPKQEAILKECLDEIFKYEFSRRRSSVTSANKIGREKMQWFSKAQERAILKEKSIIANGGKNKSQCGCSLEGDDLGSGLDHCPCPIILKLVDTDDGENLGIYTSENAPRLTTKFAQDMKLKSYRKISFVKDTYYWSNWMNN